MGVTNPATSQHTIAARDLQVGDQLSHDAAQSLLSGSHSPTSQTGTDVTVTTADRDDLNGLIEVRFHADDEPEPIRGDLQITVTRPRTTLPPNATATDVIDLVSDSVAGLILATNGRDMTKAQFDAAFDRTFPLALAKFLARLDAARPELAQHIRTDFLAEEQARHSD